MWNGTITQPLSAPWRRIANAARLQITLDRAASLVVEDHHNPVPRLHAGVFEVELVARMVLTSSDGSTIEKRVIVNGGTEPELFVRRVIETAEWAVMQHPAIAITTTHGPWPGWRELLDALHALRADLDEKVSRTVPLPREVSLDRRRRVA
jgi:hypothetical protein